LPGNPTGRQLRTLRLALLRRHGTGRIFWVTGVAGS
jgi:hypothetical protein